jgi:4-amino-4-deoxy-L-arabinose transferase-like glycosyltransferase
VNRGLHLAVLLLVAGTLLFWDLGALGLTDRDEGSNAEAAREMIESGDWITPTLNGEPRFAKPILLYWLIGASYRVFGVSEWSARLPSAVFGVLLILLQYGFLSRVRGPMAGLFGALMLLLNLEIVSIGRLVLTDSVLIFFTTLAIYGFWLGLVSTRHFMWLFYIGMALGTLTKGPVGFLIPLLAVVPYLTITRRWRHYRHEGFPLAGMLLFILLAAPWYGLMLWIHGSHYTTSAQADTVGRFFTVIGGHGGTVLFYIPVILIGFFPWSGLLPIALGQALAHWRDIRQRTGDASGVRRDAKGGYAHASPVTHHASPAPVPMELEFFASLWLIAGFIFFSVSATRLPHYIAPLFPAAALLTASLWNRGLVDPAARGLRGAIRLMMVLGYLLGIALAAAPEVYRLFIDTIVKEFPIADQVGPGTGPVMCGVILLLGMATVGYFGLSEKRRPGAFWAASAVIIAILFVGLKSTLPRLHHFFIDPPHQLAYVAGVNLNPEDRLVLYGPPKPSYIFYARRRVAMIKPGEELKMVPLLTQPGRTMILLQSRLRGTLPSETSTYSVILERYGYSLLASQPVIQVPEPPPDIKRRQFLSPHGL